MTGYTRLILTGRALQAIGSAAELARDLQPAVVVLEDVDLVAEDRSFGPGSSPVLFDLLDAMDGAAPDADLLFVLTTNRADLLEPALATRPGRVDVAIEIDLPDAEARKQLLALYGRTLPLRLSEGETREVVERTDGVTASFLKELMRRAMLKSLHEETADQTATAVHVFQALDDLLDSTQQLTRTSRLPAAASKRGAPPWVRAQHRPLEPAEDQLRSVARIDRRRERAVLATLGEPAGHTYLVLAEELAHRVTMASGRVSYSAASIAHRHMRRRAAPGCRSRRRPRAWRGHQPPSHR